MLAVGTDLPRLPNWPPAGERLRIALDRPGFGVRRGSSRIQVNATTLSSAFSQSRDWFELF